ncbi:AraC family transcriptional regulator [Nostoc sp. LPT]|uniref:helix-turn-helix transcriptional regulator n=1 Tax=Nostoc sp. LPT TaxID=2815387 RepID=UPI001DAC3982|nr:AraC family transcriptional regulator [Nostoc sp. LPT]MBN4002988.1 helix-turn-helix transcriptional regulator [Nostoc sp. LPT]
MTLILSLYDYWKLFNEEEPIWQNGDSDNFDLTRKLQIIYGEGFHREIHLRDDVLLSIYNYQSQKSIVVESPVRGHMIEFQLLPLAGSQAQNISSRVGQYFLSGSGMALESTHFHNEFFGLVEVGIHIKPEVFYSFVADISGEIPPELKHLFRRSDQPTYERYGIQTPAMLLAVQQIIQCPYQGMTKRIYFESKVWELAALIIDQELQINQGNLITTTLKSSEIERIRNAKEILLKHIHNPPSLIQLARQVGLNDRKLKQGFKQVFGTTVFGYLHNHRMELAQKLLMERNMNVTEVARTVGYASLPSFSYAFYKKFGVNPKSYQTKKVRLE